MSEEKENIWEKSGIIPPNDKDRKIRDKIISYEDFLAKEFPPNRWVAEMLIPQGITILSSAPGMYKTFLLLALSKDIVNGEPAFGQFKTEKSNILFINEECNEKLFQDRLKQIKGEGSGTFFTNLIGIKLDKKSITEILSFSKENNIKLVIFDSLTRIHNFDENSTEMKKVFEHLLELIRNDISVILTHHHRKASMFGVKNISDEMRGSSDLLAQIDCHLAIDSVAIDKTHLIIKQPKLRQAENLQDFKVNIIKSEDKTSLSFKYGGIFTIEDRQMLKVESSKEVILSIIKDNPGITQTDMAEKLKGQVGVMTTKETIRKLEKEGMIYSKTGKPKHYHLKEEISLSF